MRNAFETVSDVFSGYSDDPFVLSEEIEELGKQFRKEVDG